MAKRIRALDLFAGCGGLSKGLELAGVSVVAANEIWSDAAASHRRNHERTAMVEGDITDARVRASIISTLAGAVDVIVGGPPCQAYSLSGRRDATDPRGRLFNDYVDLVRTLQPSVFVMENVKGILSMTHDQENLSTTALKKLGDLRAQIDDLPDKYTRDLADKERLAEGRARRSALLREMKEFQEPVITMITRSFERLGFDVKFQILNAADFGVPQRRERVVIIGHHRSSPIFPVPTHSRREAATDLFGERAQTWTTVREAIDDLKDAPENKEAHHVYPFHSPQFLQKIHRTPIGSSVFASYSDAFFRCPPDEPSRTVKENHNGVFVHYEKDRVMTPRELARLQSFDDGFLFCGKKSSVLKQLGNAVPVGLGRAIGGAILEMAG
jgi:DNA (cytosine-5)-methyltransferase 1